MTRTAVGTRVRVNFYFDTAMFDGLRRLAGLKNTTYSELIRVACREYLVRETEAAIRADKAIKEIGQ
jgi:hypothetical protein